MDLALAIAKSGLEAQHNNIAIISNNLANANTTAYKRSRAEFVDLPYEIIKQPGTPTSQETNSPNGFVLGTGTKLVGNTKVFKTGQPLPAGPLDVAINGRGFLQVQMPNGNGFAYTRAGHLRTNEQGQLTLPNGYVLQPAITLPQGYTRAEINPNGSVVVTTQDGQTQEIGQLQLADFVNPEGLVPMGQNLYMETLASGPATLNNPGNNGVGEFWPNMLESSNVDVVEEMVSLIEAQRAFEITSKAVSAVDNMMQFLSRET